MHYRVEVSHAFLHKKSRRSKTGKNSLDLRVLKETGLGFTSRGTTNMLSDNFFNQLCFVFVYCSFGQSGLREDLCVVQRSSAGQSDRLRAEPGQRRGTEGCSQILSGGRTTTQLHSDLCSLISGNYCKELHLLYCR